MLPGVHHVAAGGTIIEETALFMTSSQLTRNTAA